MQLLLKTLFVVTVSGFLLVDGMSLLWRGLALDGLRPVPRDHPVDQLLFFLFGDAVWPSITGLLEVGAAIGLLCIFFWRAFAKTEKRI